jgi:GTP cyclohydrolase IA
MQYVRKTGTPTKEQAQEAVRTLLQFIGEDPNRPGLVDTPRRFVEAFTECTSGYGLNPGDVTGNALFDEKHNEIVIVKDIPIHSLCEHHLLPFFGKVHIGYIPKGKVIGLSKLARLASECFARRLQVQERLTTQIAEELERLVPSHAVGVIVECTHLCMEMRGIESIGARTITSKMLGSFHSDEILRHEFMSMVGYNNNNRAITPTRKKCRNNGCCESPVLQPVATTIPLAMNVGFDDTNDFLLYAKCADEEYQEMANLVIESITGMSGPLSLLDVGAGNGVLVKELYARDIRFSHYEAFEPNMELASQLEQLLGDQHFRVASTYCINREEFSPTTNSDQYSKVDIALISHSLYGVEDKCAILVKAMEFVAPGGILVVFHRNTATVNHLSKKFAGQGVLSHVTSRRFSLKLEGLNKEELTRLSVYMKQDLESLSYPVVKRTVGMFATEPHCCNLSDQGTVTMKVDDTRLRVSFGARSGKPAAVVQPATGTKKMVKKKAFRYWNNTAVLTFH